jgi:hypothetical protein
MKPEVSGLLLNPSPEKHIALLYRDNEELNPAIATYINEGLKRGQFCVYATVHYRDEGYLEAFANLVPNYKENIANENLMVIDLAPLYISALLGNMKPFDEARKMFLEKAKGRQDEHIRFVGDGTGFLFKHKHYDECVMVEEWWQEKPFAGSYVCPFEKQIFDSFPHKFHSDSTVVNFHDIVVNASDERLFLQPAPDKAMQEYISNDAAINGEGLN